ncbi:hypothetical protein OAB36_01235 [Pelagibacteraceae bacterium]|jgi:hypothetical protein|nr:hypothetical protein [Pelagibacteraceae bacterium]|tara:strand:- start:472 stop:948 length:477 start_codon:yes stop_codon:yes gene_type:complete
MIKTKERDRVNEIAKKLNLNKLPFKIDENNLNSLGLDIANDLTKVLNELNANTALKWCLSTIKRAKVFIIIYQANVNSQAIYKEEIAKKLPEYSYKTIATIIDEGFEKGYYVSLDPVENNISDKKIKNIRPSIEVITAFYNWNIDRISSTSKLSEKYK